MPSLGQVLAAMDELYDPRTAESWDAVGLVVGDPVAPVRRVLFAVDPADAVVDEALGWGADLVVTHHPLLLRGVHGVPASDPKGARVHRLVRAGVALLTAHTNADVADPGVSDALAAAVGVRVTGPLRALAADLDKVVAFVPAEHAERLVDALARAGAGRLGAYERCAWTSTGVGTFLPLPGAHPERGTVGRVEQVAEARIEMVLPRSARAAVVGALRSVHPYEEPAFDVLELAAFPGRLGLGRVGELAAAVPLREFVERVAAALPVTAVGVRASGDPDRSVRRVAVCGGAGDSLLGEARAAGVDAFVTADLRHHPATESAEAGGPALVDPGHWASEWPWLAPAAARLQERLARTGDTVEIRVSRTVTDPWTVQSTPEPATSEPSTPEPSTPEPSTPEPATPEPSTPEPSTGRTR